MLGLFLLLSAMLPTACGQPSPRTLYEAAAAFRVPLDDTQPVWADRDDPPLATIAWLTDLHLAAGPHLAVAEAAARYINTSLRPGLVAVTGDNCALRDEGPGSRGVQRNRCFKTWLDEHLDAPSLVIPGDNWPWGFAEAFGAMQYSVDVAGYHLAFLAPDRSCRGVEGCSVFDPVTLTWLKEDLAAAAGRPAIVFLHEPLVPPTFIDAGRVLTVIREAGNVIGVCAGHLHVDLEFDRGGITHLCGPAVGPSPAHGFKELRLYRDMVLVLTHECAPESTRYAPVSKWQRIIVPETMRSKLAASALQSVPSEPSGPPPHPRTDDRTLAQRQIELFAQLSLFLLTESTSPREDTPR